MNFSNAPVVRLAPPTAERLSPEIFFQTAADAILGAKESW